MAQYKVTYTIYTDPSHSVSEPGMSSLTMVVQADTNAQACQIVENIYGPNVGQVQASQM